jgi:hypothetical protein
MDINETKHETYGALGIAGMLAGMLGGESDSTRFTAILAAIVVLVLFSGIQRLMVKRWKMQYGENIVLEPTEEAGVYGVKRIPDANDTSQVTG